MLRPATTADLPAIEAFLADHAESSMFLRANLRSHGLGRSDSPFAMRLMLSHQGRVLSGVFGVSAGGYALCQAPEATPDDWSDFAHWLEGRKLVAISGEARQIAQAKPALGLTPVSLARDLTEPLYRLDLNDLRADALAPGHLRPPAEGDRALLHDWFRAYTIEMMGTPPDRAEAEAAGQADRALSGGQIRLLEQGGTPVAMTGFNAPLPDIVQVGGVYTPPDARNRRLARTAVALHLAEARERGIQVAVLFASGPPACRAYEALGFQRIGTYGVAILREPRHA